MDKDSGPPRAFRRAALSFRQAMMCERGQMTPLQGCPLEPATRS